MRRLAVRFSPFALTSTLYVPPKGRAPPQEQQEQQEELPPPERPTSTKLLEIEEEANGRVIVSLHSKPVNSLSLEVFEELSAWLRYLAYDDACKSVILASKIPKVFSAGLDINELRQATPERFPKFWGLFQDCWMMLHSYPKPLVAAIGGNCPAGGCVLALGCDIRVMAQSATNGQAYRIGLNEVRLGIIPPPWVMASLSYTVGQRTAERMLQLGETPTADKALALGLVDVVVAEDKVLDAAREECEKFTPIAPQARYLVRDIMRQEVTQFLSNPEARQYDTKYFMEMLNEPQVKSSIEQYLARLSGKK